MAFDYVKRPGRIIRLTLMQWLNHSFFRHPLIMHGKPKQASATTPSGLTSDIPTWKIKRTKALSRNPPTSDANLASQV
jgi:hypothetical protein